MAKTWADIRSETLNLGFEKIKAYDKNQAAYVEAYNWRQGLIASDIGGLLDNLTISATSGDTRQVFDLEQIATDNGYDYVGLADIGVTDEYGNKIEDAAFTDNRFLIMPATADGDFRVYYFRMPELITTASANDTEVELPRKWVNLMPYLMANRLYLDDDASKAGYYWNLFDNMRNRLLYRENMPTVTIVGGRQINDEVIW